MARRLLVAQCLFGLGAGLTLWACGSSSSSPSPVLNGMWGGDHIALTVADSGTHLQFDCAYGDIPGIVMENASTEFNASGTFVRLHGGPIRVGDLPDSHPAAFVGTATATAMRLTVRLIDTNEVIGTFTLSRGSPGRLVPCVLPL